MDAADRLAMLMFDRSGSKDLAHEFIHDVAARPLYSMKYNLVGELRQRIRCKFRLFIPPKDQDRVVMFEDNSGAYIFAPDGFVTPMGKDISHEVGAWEEVIY